MLTDLQCKTATCPPEKKRVRYADSGGLYLEVTDKAKRWFWKYRFAGKEKRLALGSYPAVSLKQARLDRDEARLTLARRIDPVQQRLVRKASAIINANTTYRQIAEECLSVKQSGWSEVHANKWMRLQEAHVFPYIGSLPIADINTPVALSVLNRIVKKGLIDTAHTIRQYIGQVCRYAIATGRSDNDPTSALRGALPPLIVKHMGALVDPAEVAELMRNIEVYNGQPTTRYALQLSALLFQRPGNIRQMEWAWVDLDKAMLTFPAMAMKRRVQAKQNGRSHLVPLSRQAIEILKNVHAFTGHGRYVFPSIRTGERPMSENTVNVALRGLGYSGEQMTAHGFRAMARTILEERLGVPEKIIEAQLAHAKKGPLGEAYDRTQFIEQRKEMMQLWADYLDKLRDGQAE